MLSPVTLIFSAGSGFGAGPGGHRVLLWLLCHKCSYSRMLPLVRVHGPAASGFFSLLEVTDLKADRF